jgi:paired amphipathic helix protein Sin3a
MLFKDAPDLIAEFKAFLPEAVGSGGGLLDHGGMIMGPQAVGPPLDAWGQRELEQRHPSPQLAAASKKQPAANKSRRKRPLEKEPTPVPVAPPKASTSRVRFFVLTNV